MKRRGWRQKELAEALERNNSVISRWLYGERSPDRNSSLHIYNVLGIKPALWGKKPVKAFTPPAFAEAA